MRSAFRVAHASLATALLVVVAQLWSEDVVLKTRSDAAGVFRAGGSTKQAKSNRTHGYPQTVESGNNLKRSSYQLYWLSTGLPPPPANKERSSNELSLLPLRTCRQVFFPITNKDNYSLPIEYQCSGTEYNNFTSQLHQFASDRSQHSGTWGRRPEPIPPNMSVLFLGNSHTRQTALEYACQYSDQIDRVHQFHARALAFRFKNAASMYLVYNSPVEIALNWTRQLEILIERPLQSFQAVVLGQFNGAGPDVRNSSYYRQMMNWSESQSDTGLQLGKVEPPDVVRVARLFHGPIVFASNYDHRKTESFQIVLQALRTIKLRTNRTNLVGIWSRKYMAALGGNECGTEIRQGVGTCRRPRVMSHRCVGPNGGHPTLIAHDIQEALYSFLAEKEVE